METPLSPAVTQALSTLTAAQQIEVINLAKRAKPTLSREERLKKLAELAGSISKEDAKAMMEAIDEDCGRINHDAW